MAIRKPWVGGNWKCNGTQKSIRDLATALNKASFCPTKLDVAIFPTSIHISLTREVLDEKFIVGSQNISKTGNGAFTGEISVDMVKDCGLKWTLIGHSERRTLFGECDKTVAEKVKLAQDQDLNVGLCIGETLEEREAGKTDEVCARQLKACFPVIKDWNKIVIAYEPVWAIGTGKVATSAQAQEAHQHIRDLISKEVSPEVAEAVRIVYGGSVNEKNCAELIEMGDIDGFLVGGASLKPTFNDIIAAVASRAN